MAPQRLRQATVFRELLEPFGGRGIFRGRALELGHGLRVAGTPELFDLQPVGLRADLAQELDAALERAGGLELIAQHRGQ